MIYTYILTKRIYINKTQKDYNLLSNIKYIKFYILYIKMVCIKPGPVTIKLSLCNKPRIAI